MNRNMKSEYATQHTEKKLNEIESIDKEFEVFVLARKPHKVESREWEARKLRPLPTRAQGGTKYTVALPRANNCAENEYSIRDH